MSHSRQPYTYTLPEQFMNDPTVPMHWKLYALINGFWIGGKSVFASNAYFAEKLGCSERYVRECLSVLENLGVLNREGRSQNRRIVPASRVEEGGTSSSYQGGTNSSVRAEPTVPHSSVSSSVSILSEVETSRMADFVIVEDKPRSKKPDVRPVYRLFTEVLGIESLPWTINKSQRQAAEQLSQRFKLTLIKSALEYVKEHQDDELLPQILSPWDLNSKWEQLRKYQKKHGG